VFLLLLRTTIYKQRARGLLYITIAQSTALYNIYIIVIYILNFLFKVQFFHFPLVFSIGIANCLPTPNVLFLCRMRVHLTAIMTELKFYWPFLWKCY